MSPLIVEDEEQPAVEANRERAYGIGRLMAFSDGVFAIAITLLVLNVPVPDIARVEAASRLPAELLAAAPRLITFALSFFLVGFYWIRHHQLFRELLDVDAWLLWLNLLVLFFVCLLPFSSGVIGRYFSSVVAAEVYAVNLAAIVLSFTALNIYASRARLVRHPSGTVTQLLSRGFLWPLLVVALVMVLAPLNLTVAYVIGTTLMATVSVYTVLPESVRSAPLAGTREGLLRFDRIARRATLRGDTRLLELFRGRFLGPEPLVTVAGNEVNVQDRSPRWWRKWRPQSADVALNTSIAWRIDVKTGVNALIADLRDIRLSGLSLAGGTNQLELRLPRPSGTVPIRLRDGCVKVSIRRPVGVAIRAAFPDGAARVQLDEQRLGPLLDHMPVESPGYATATDRYDLDFQGGVAHLTIGIDTLKP